MLVSSIGRFGDCPPTDREGFLAVAEALHSYLPWRIIKDGEQLSPVAYHRVPAGVQKHYEEMDSLGQFIAIGDALCIFNPIHAQGMSAAARSRAFVRRVAVRHRSSERGLDR